MNKKIAFLGILLLAVVVTGYSVSGTYAKYTSQIDLSDEARVAKWEIGMNSDAMETLDLFDESYTYASNGTVVEAIANAEGKKDNVVAPGTNGQYTFALKGNIETNYTIDVNATGTNNVVLKAEDGTITHNPMKFYLDTNDSLDINAINGWYDFDTLLTKLNALYSGTGSKVYAPGTVDNTSHTIYWKWDFETTGNADAIKAANEKDTKLGEEIAADATSHKIDLAISITANQTNEKAN